PGRKGVIVSWPKSSFSEFLRDPGTEWTEKRLGGCMEVVFIWLDGEVACEGANTLKKPGDEVTLEVENLVGREKPGKPESPYSGGVVGSLTGPEMPAFARSRAS